MSLASAVANIKWIQKSGTYLPWISSPSGDLWQEYDSPDSGATCTPNWTSATTKPVLEFVAISSRAAIGEMDVADGDISWYVNDVQLTFSGGVSTGTWNGIFQKTTSNGRQALMILKNVAIVAGFASITIKAVVNITDGTNADTIQATYTIPIQQTSGEAYKATIIAGDANNFVINTDGGSCKLKAVVLFNGTIRESAGTTYKWFVLSGSKWVDTGLTTQTITVSESDIATYGEYKVEVKIPEVSDVLSDVQGVMDTTDPYVVAPGATPESMSIEQDSGGTVVFSPKLMTRAGATVSPQPTWAYAIRDSRGTLLGSTNTVTEAMCKQAGGGVSMTITANE